MKSFLFSLAAAALVLLASCSKSGEPVPMEAAYAPSVLTVVDPTGVFPLACDASVRFRTAGNYFYLDLNVGKQTTERLIVRQIDAVVRNAAGTEVFTLTGLYSHALSESWTYTLGKGTDGLVSGAVYRVSYVISYEAGNKPGRLASEFSFVAGQDAPAGSVAEVRVTSLLGFSASLGSVTRSITVENGTDSPLSVKHIVSMVRNAGGQNALMFHHYIENNVPDTVAVGSDRTFLLALQAPFDDPSVLVSGDTYTCHTGVTYGMGGSLDQDFTFVRPQPVSAGPFEPLTLSSAIEFNPEATRANLEVSVTNHTDSAFRIAHIGAYIVGLSGRLVGFHYYGNDGAETVSPSRTQAFPLQVLPMAGGEGDPWRDLAKLTRGQSYSLETTVIGSHDLSGSTPVVRYEGDAGSFLYPYPL